MLSINPGTNFPIVRKLGDPSDVGVNFVRAVVRNSTTGVVLATINLTDQGEQRFTGFYAVGAAENYFIDITTLVYTDDTYSTKSPVYTEENDTYHIQTNWSPQLSGVLGGGVDINYKKIDSLIKENLATLKLITVDDFSSIFSKLEKSIIDVVGSKYKTIQSDLSLVLTAIKSIEIPDQKETDLSGVILSINNLKTNIDQLAGRKIDTQEITGMLSTALNDLLTHVKDSHSRINNSIDGVSQNIDKTLKENVALKDQTLVKIKNAIGEITSDTSTPKIETPLNKNFSIRKRIFGKK